MNCWTFKKCNREKDKSCTAFTSAEHDGMNNGVGAGRYCWAVAGTLCGGEVQGEFAKKKAACIVCDFYLKVKKEEGDNFILHKDF